ncbi:MAG: ribokinase [Actinomycetota bacterium]
MRASTVIVVGSVNVDLTTQVERIPAPGETVIGGTFGQSPGGKGGNQAAAAARLGARTWIVGLVGDDAFGATARADLAGSGVDVTHLGTGRGPTGVAQIIVDGLGENLIAVASGANEELGRAAVEAALERIPGAGAVVLANLEIPLEAVAAAASWAEANGCVFVLNPAPARALPEDLLALCDVLTPNEHEARALGARSAEELVERGAPVVVRTRGGRGADLLRAGAPPRHQEAFEVEVVDTTGAGDAFSAALAWSLGEGRDMERAVEYAAAAGALATRAVGARAGAPDRAEVEALVEGR